MRASKPEDNFGYQDFLLIKAKFADVRTAIEQEISGQAPADADIDATVWKPGPIAWLLLALTPFGRSLKRGLAAQDDLSDRNTDIGAPPYVIHEGQEARNQPLLTVDYFPAYGPDQPPASVEMRDDIRLRSTPHDEWVLVEYYEHVSGMSMLGFSLSMALPDTDVLYFRRSGRDAKEQHYDFHIYHNGDTRRRVLCHSTRPMGAPEQEWWEGISDGPVTPYEPDDLYAGATEHTLLNNDKLDAILATIPLSFEQMFDTSKNIILFTR